MGNKANFPELLLQEDADRFLETEMWISVLSRDRFVLFFFFICQSYQRITDYANFNRIVLTKELQSDGFKCYTLYVSLIVLYTVVMWLLKIFLIKNYMVLIKCRLKAENPCQTRHLPYFPDFTLHFFHSLLSPATYSLKRFGYVFVPYSWRNF